MKFLTNLIGFIMVFNTGIICIIVAISYKRVETLARHAY